MYVISDVNWNMFSIYMYGLKPGFHIAVIHMETSYAIVVIHYADDRQRITVQLYGCPRYTVLSLCVGERGVPQSHFQIRWCG